MGANPLAAQLGRVRIDLKYWPAVVATALGILISAATALFLFEFRRAEIESWRSRGVSTITLLAGQINIMVANVEATIDGALAEIAEFGIHAQEAAMEVLATEPFFRRLKLAAVSYNNYIRLSVVSADGDFIVTTTGFPPPPANIAHRDYFKQCMAARIGEVIISEALKSVIDGDDNIALCKPLITKQGETIGVVIGSLSRALLIEIFEQSKEAVIHQAILVRDDGLIIAAAGATAHFQAIGDRIPNAVFIRQYEAAERGLWTTGGGSNRFMSLPRIVEAKRVGTFPLIIGGATMGEIVLANWTRVAWLVSLTAAALVAALLVLGLRASKVLALQDAMLLAERRARAAAEASDRAQTEFVSLVSHDVRTPLMALLASSELLRKEQTPPDRTRCLDLIRSSGEQLQSIVTSILNFATMDRAIFAATSERFSLRDVIEKTTEICCIGIGDKPLVLETRIGEMKSPFLMGKKGLLEQVLLNLVTNAVKFTDSGRI